MPYLKIQTNIPLTKKAEQNILRIASSLVSQELERAEEFVMIAVQPDTPMMLAGTDDPVAFLELKSIGLKAARTKGLSKALSEMIEQHLGIPKDRVYAKFIDVKRGMWGWKGSTFDKWLPREPSQL